MIDPKKWLIDWFASQKSQVELNPKDNYFVIGAIDSMEIIFLIEEIEKVFCIRFSQEDFQNERFASINGLAEMILEKRRL